MKDALEQLYKFDRQLLGSGYDNALNFIDHLIGIETIDIPSGTELGTWTVPEEWVVKEAWVKFNGEKILDYAQNPLSLVVYSLPFKGTVTREELQQHLHHAEDSDEVTPYTFKFYERDWGFSMPKIEMADGEYEVFIDTEFRPGTMKLGVHTISGKSDREVLIFAHLDHPHQANDNLSGVVCLLELANKLKCDHTIKLVFCPETIGSQAYAYTQDLSKVDFVIAVDICGNDSSIMFQKSWDDEHRINRVVHCALQVAGKPYRKGKFRTSIGSDETVFNDPLIGVPGVLFTTWPYPEYHTDRDTPEIINYEKISEVADLIVKTIEIYEKDYIPERLFKGPLMRSRYKIQSPIKRVNLIWDYLVYLMDGKRHLSEICADMETSFDQVYEAMEKVVADGKLKKNDSSTKNRNDDVMDGKVRRPDARKGKVKKASR